MSGIRPRLSNAGPNTYPVSEAVKGGMLVAPAADQVANKGKVRPAPADSMLCLGVSEIDAKPWANPVTVDADGFDVVNAAPLPTEATVGFGRYEVTYTADAAFGQALKCGANGAVTPVAADGDPRLIVGYCDEPNGVVVATKATGLANISR
jgi:hypothetical protein